MASRGCLLIYCSTMWRLTIAGGSSSLVASLRWTNFHGASLRSPCSHLDLPTTAHHLLSVFRRITVRWLPPSFSLSLSKPSCFWHHAWAWASYAPFASPFSCLAICSVQWSVHRQQDYSARRWWVPAQFTTSAPGGMHCPLLLRNFSTTSTFCCGKLTCIR